jgi:hypothetical protein
LKYYDNLFSSKNSNWNIFSIKYILKIYLRIITYQLCDQCRIETLRSIQTKSMIFNIPQQDHSTIIIQIDKPPIIIIDRPNTITTIKGYLFHFFFFTKKKTNHFKFEVDLDIYNHTINQIKYKIDNEFEKYLHFSRRIFSFYI